MIMTKNEWIKWSKNEAKRGKINLVVISWDSSGKSLFIYVSMRAIVHVKQAIDQIESNEIRFPLLRF